MFVGGWWFSRNIKGMHGGLLNEVELGYNICIEVLFVNRRDHEQQCGNASNIQ